MRNVKKKSDSENLRDRRKEIDKIVALNVAEIRLRRLISGISAVLAFTAAVLFFVSATGSVIGGVEGVNVIGVVLILLGLVESFIFLKRKR